MAKEVNVPSELETAVDKVLDLGLSQVRAKDLFRYALITRAIKRENGNEAQAARKLGMSRAQINGLPEALAVRLG